MVSPSKIFISLILACICFSSLCLILPADFNKLAFHILHRHTFNLFSFPDQGFNWFLSETGTFLKKVIKGSGQGAGRLKSGAYTLVCEHFETSRNTALGT